jgi:2-polyprenyl-6-methoxyphenol hydroxylase-like FAD-dependent oxidoreductase
MDSAATVFARLLDAEPSGARELFDTACVVGGSVAGLLAARVLSDYARQVVIVERDFVSESTLARQGVPHGQQLHVLLPGGRHWMDRWLPGWTDELVGRGAIMSSSEAALEIYDGHRQAPVKREYATLGATRPLLESRIRANVLCRRNISVLRARATGLRYRGAAVSAVEFAAETGRGALETDFVVDAMGRSSRLTHWLHQGGFERPRLERLATSINYATGLFERPDQLADLDVTSVLAIATPETAVDGISIASVTAVEDNQWIVALIGYGDDRPGTTVDQMRTSCAKLHPAFGRAVQRLATQAVQTYHQDDSRRRHFAETGGFPARLVSVGDAAASFNPIYGQGMSSSALHASCLAVYLDDVDELDTAATEFFRLQDVVVDAAWSVSAGTDLARLDAQSGVEPPESVRRHRWAQEQVLNASLLDGDVAEVLRDVHYMLRHPAALSDPALVERAVAINTAA